MGFKISLVIPTIHRTKELARLLKSIESQKEIDLSTIEIILVDQNPAGYLDETLSESKLLIRRLAVPSKGLSYAKNAGLYEAKGDWIQFPDDDCWFPEDFLKRLFTQISETHDDAIFFSAYDPKKHLYLVSIPSGLKEISKFSSKAFCAPQIAQVYKTLHFQPLGGFDENLGVGSGEFGSGEDTDIALRFLKAGHRIQVAPEIQIYHPLVNSESMSTAKIKLYASGFGAVCVKNGLYFHWIFKSLKQIAGSLLFFLLMDKKAKTAFFTGYYRFIGGFKYFSRRT